MDALFNENVNPEAAPEKAAEEASAASAPASEEASVDKAKLTVGGFVFGTPEDADLARQDLHRIEYLEQKINYHVPENILAVYNKVLESKVFQTPLGWDYLHKMQIHMRKSGIGAADITPIPIHSSLSPHQMSEVAESVAVSRIERRLVHEKAEAAKIKSRFRSLVGLCVALAVLVFAMFIIAMTSNQPNILNYERVLQNKYAAWEQELTEREQAVRIKEQALDTE
ncbi:MAG: hypothetical protein LBI54_09925 [Lachnospiraceae bacterium]|jgi:hypothetical protein|nr:hypothetical protein [Lachnospiraceae bacterium]